MTVNVSQAGSWLVVILPVVDKAPAAIQLVYVPAAGAVKSTFTVQD